MGTIPVVTIPERAINDAADLRRAIHGALNREGRSVGQLAKQAGVDGRIAPDTVFALFACEKEIPPGYARPNPRIESVIVMLELCGLEITVRARQ